MPAQPFSYVNSFNCYLQKGGHIYYLKNKDTILGTFRWEAPGGLEVPTLEENLGLPAFVARNLNFWLQSRRPPKRRRHIQEVCGLTSTRAIINVSLGLSLTDCLWITKDSCQSWEEVNLFENPFNETIAEIAFTGGSYSVSLVSPSPEFSTDGVLAKCWVREGRKIYLKKTGAEKAIYAEVLASQVCEALGVPHVDYRLDKFYGRLCSSCELLTSPTVMMVPSYLYYDYKTASELHALLERDGLLHDYGKLLLADFTLRNVDRHPGNIGILLDVDTFKLMGLSPVYDNGQSFFFPGGPAMYDSWAEVLGSMKPPILQDFRFDGIGVPTEYIDKAYATITDSLAELG